MEALDPQKQALYAWEDGWQAWSEGNKTLREVRATVRKACRLYGVKPPRIVGHKHNGWTTYHPDEDFVTWQRGQRNTAIALHEAAHVILFKICKQEADEESDGNFEDHGPEFLGVYIFLLAKFGVAPLIALTSSARQAGLKFIPVQVSEPSRFRRLVSTKLA